jgi:hypothetical protein
MRLVFEVGILNYYFLAVGVAFLLLDLTCRRPPLWSVAWIVTARYALPWFVPHAPAGLTAAVLVVIALVPIGLGLAQVPAEARSSLPVIRSGVG